MINFFLANCFLTFDNVNLSDRISDETTNRKKKHNLEKYKITMQAPMFDQEFSAIIDDLITPRFGLSDHLTFYITNHPWDGCYSLRILPRHYIDSTKEIVKESPDVLSDQAFKAAIKAKVNTVIMKGRIDFEDVIRLFDAAQGEVPFRELTVPSGVDWLPGLIDLLEKRHLKIKLCLEADMMFDHPYLYSHVVKMYHVRESHFKTVEWSRFSMLDLVSFDLKYYASLAIFLLLAKGSQIKEIKLSLAQHSRPDVKLALRNGLLKTIVDNFFETVPALKLVSVYSRGIGYKGTDLKQGSIEKVHYRTDRPHLIIGLTYYRRDISLVARCAAVVKQEGLDDSDLPTMIRQIIKK